MLQKKKQQPKKKVSLGQQREEETLGSKEEIEVKDRGLDAWTTFMKIHKLAELKVKKELSYCNSPVQGHLSVIIENQIYWDSNYHLSQNTTLIIIPGTFGQNLNQIRVQCKRKIQFPLKNIWASF